MSSPSLIPGRFIHIDGIIGTSWQHNPFEATFRIPLALPITSSINYIRLCNGVAEGLPSNTSTYLLLDGIRPTSFNDRLIPVLCKFEKYGKNEPAPIVRLSESEVIRELRLKLIAEDGTTPLDLANVRIAFRLDFFM